MTDDLGLPAPTDIGMSSEAKSRWVAFHDEWSVQLFAVDGALAACHAKLKSYAARFALLDHIVRYAPSGRDCQVPVEQTSIEVGIKAARWFAREARRVYGQFSLNYGQRKTHDLRELIRRKGGDISARELQQASRHYNSSDIANAALDKLVDRGVGRWEESGHTRRFVLSDAPNQSCDVA